MYEVTSKPSSVEHGLKKVPSDFSKKLDKDDLEKQVEDSAETSKALKYQNYDLISSLLQV